METKRRKFQGVLNILSFNRHYYIVGSIVLTLLSFGWIILKLPLFWLWIIIALFVYGFVMPLIVSAYVYDFSGYYNFNWLDDIQETNPNQIVNINAGFDETSYILKSKFPESNLKVFDFYNPKQHTEPAIVRARKVSLIYPNTQQITTDFIPLKDNSVDILFLLSAAHEIRNQNEKIKFLVECKRALKSTGKIIMLEHLRDFPNFMAFSIGFTHFFSKKTWKKAFKKSGFSNITETKFTPFMSIFNCSH